MTIQSYRQRRAEIEHYFDHTAAEAWSKLTSNSPVGRIRSTVRAGRDSMRAALLEHLGPDLHGKRILDAGCGTGALSIEAARRGAEVVAIDLSPSLVKLAQERCPSQFDSGSIDFRVGDMLDSSLGSFDHIVAMDSLIHYQTEDALAVIADLAQSSRCTIQFTFAPHTPLLGVMHAVGKYFPAGNRAPKIVPVRETHLHFGINNNPRLEGWCIGRTKRIKSGFYQSQALEIVKR